MSLRDGDVLEWSDGSCGVVTYVCDGAYVFHVSDNGRLHPALGCVRAFSGAMLTRITDEVCGGRAARCTVKRGSETNAHGLFQYILSVYGTPSPHSAREAVRLFCKEPMQAVGELHCTPAPSLRVPPPLTTEERASARSELELLFADAVARYAVVQRV